MKTKEEVLADFKDQMAIVEMIQESGFTNEAKDTAVDAIQAQVVDTLRTARKLGIISLEAVASLRAEYDL